jgi:hypothetical protein
MKIGILIISDRGARGEYEDRSGPVIAQMLAEKRIGRSPHARSFLMNVAKRFEVCNNGVMMDSIAFSLAAAPAFHPAISLRKRQKR